MRGSWKRRREARRMRRHVAVLSRTESLEMTLGMGSYADTLAQMRQLLDQVEQLEGERRSGLDQLLAQMRERIGHLETVIHRRETEFDQLQERFCALQDQMGARDGQPVNSQPRR